MAYGANEQAAHVESWCHFLQMRDVRKTMITELFHDVVLLRSSSPPDLPFGFAASEASMAVFRRCWRLFVDL